VAGLTVSPSHRDANDVDQGFRANSSRGHMFAMFYVSVSVSGLGRGTLVS
jgi:hypothetical protein